MAARIYNPHRKLGKTGGVRSRSGGGRPEPMVEGTADWRLKGLPKSKGYKHPGVPEAKTYVVWQGMSEHHKAGKPTPSYRQGSIEDEHFGVILADEEAYQEKRPGRILPMPHDTAVERAAARIRDYKAARRRGMSARRAFKRDMNF